MMELELTSLQKKAIPVVPLEEPGPYIPIPYNFAASSSTQPIPEPTHHPSPDQQLHLQPQQFPNQPTSLAIPQLSGSSSIPSANASPAEPSQNQFHFPQGPLSHDFVPGWENSDSDRINQDDATNDPPALSDGDEDEDLVGNTTIRPSSTPNTAPPSFFFQSTLPGGTTTFLPPSLTDEQRFTPTLPGDTTTFLPSLSDQQRFTPTQPSSRLVPEQLHPQHDAIGSNAGQAPLWSARPGGPTIDLHELHRRLSQPTHVVSISYVAQSIC
jgi:hypothetical protein